MGFPVLGVAQSRCMRGLAFGWHPAGTRTNKKNGKQKRTHHFPNPYVLYPASRNASASCRSAGSKPDPGNGNSCGLTLKCARPIRTGCRPVWSALRDGPHCVPGTIIRVSKCGHIGLDASL